LGLEAAGFSVVLGVDSDPICIETRQANFAGCSFCADLSEPRTGQKIVTALKGVFVSLLAAAPPCQPFSRAGRSKIRSLEKPARERHKKRSELWRSVLELVKGVRPGAVLFENVPGLTEGEDIAILAQLVEGLEGLGYAIHLRRLAARDFGVPQHRERVFVVAVGPENELRWPEPEDGRVSLRDAISDLPAVEAGAQRPYCDYKGPQTPLQDSFRRGVPEQDRYRIYDHYARAVRDDDLEAFRLMDHGTKYSDLPEHLKRYRDDIFEDKYKRLSWESVSRTITAHLAKDGYWYIHPEQHRTLTVREAARIQTFPDWFRFTGTPTHQWRQIGNAVPPLLAQAVGQALFNCLTARRQKRPGQASKHIATLSRTTLAVLSMRNALLKWWSDADRHALAKPWLKAESVWQLLLGMVLFERQASRLVSDFWPTFSRRWPTPKAFLADRQRDVGLRVLERIEVGKSLAAIARQLARGTAPKALPAFDGISSDRVRLCCALANAGVPCEPSVPVVRVAARLLGEEPTNSRMDGQLLLVRILGAEKAAAIYAAVLEIAERFCRSSAPACSDCPLQLHCPTGKQSTTVQT
jgi:DNA (cytosine-5)-methyltransferase 1